MKLIVAVEKNWGIGKDNGLLVHLPGDLKYFKERTMGKTVVMGRKTRESLPGGRPLPKRTNIVITRNDQFEKEGCLVAKTVEEAVALAKEASGGSTEDVMVMGGESIYRQMLPLCDTCYITKINKAFDADAFFPDLDADPEFQVVWESEEQEENGVTYRFIEYKRV